MANGSSDEDQPPNRYLRSNPVNYIQYNRDNVRDNSQRPLHQRTLPTYYSSVARTVHTSQTAKPSNVTNPVIRTSTPDSE